MNNTINNVSNVSFNARYLNIKNPEKMPKQVYDAIYKSDAIDDFLHAGAPKTLWGKIKDMFKKDEILNVAYYVVKDIKKTGLFVNGRYKSEVKAVDPFKKYEILLFSFGEEGFKKRQLELKGSQEGVRRKAGSIPRPNEHPIFKAPAETSTESIVKQVEGIKDLDKLLK